MPGSEPQPPFVLIVEDNPLIRRQLSAMLQSKYAVKEAASGKEALAYLKTGKIPDIILLDIIMPGMDGYQVCMELKDNKVTSDVPVVFLTSKDETKDIVKAFEYGAVDYLIKPFRKEEMLIRVNNHVEYKLARDYQRKLIEGKNQLIAELEKALKEIKTLRGLIPICLHCKRIRDDDRGYWKKLEQYIGEHSEVQLSHGICPECIEKYYPEMVHPNCWEYKGCDMEEVENCPAVLQNRGKDCWLVAGTMCKGDVQGNFANKIVSCLECDYYKFSTFKVDNESLE